MVREITQKTEFFWTDGQQARERLNGCIILYGDEPYYVEGILPERNYVDGSPRATLVACQALADVSTEAKRTTKSLASPHFHKFRELPALGWVNFLMSEFGTPDVTPRAVFLVRRSLRRTLHGLQNDNVRVFSFEAGEGVPALIAGNYNYSNIYSTEAYVQACKKQFPSLEEILQNIEPGQAIAYNPTYAVCMGKDSIRWLFRERERIGMFTSTDSLYLLRSKKHYIEEIQNDPTFTCNTITEF